VSFDFQFVRKNWYYFAGAIIGIVILYELAKRAGGSSSASSDTASGFVGASGQPISSLQAGADVAASNNNAQIAVAQIQGQVASNGIIAAQNASEAQTAAQLQLGLAQTAAAETLGLTVTNNDVQKTALAVQGAVDIQSIQSDAAVKQTAIEGGVITKVASLQAGVQQAQVNAVAKQISTIQSFSKHASQDYSTIAPIIALELGQGDAAPGIASAVAGASASKTASISGAIASFGGTLLKGLFGNL
jgi:hypothetical protein